MEEILQFIDNKALPEEKLDILLFLLKLLTSETNECNSSSCSISMDQEVNDELYVNNHHDHVHVNSIMHVHSSSSSLDVKKNTSTSVISLQQDEQSQCSFSNKIVLRDCKYKLNICNGQHDIIITRHVSTFLKDPFIVDTLDTMANKCAIRKIKRKRGRPRKNCCK